MNFLTNLNLNKNELQNAKIQNLAIAPTAPAKGQIYFNTVSNTFMGYDGAEWVSLGALGFSGNYNDLTNKPKIPQINDAAPSNTTTYSGSKTEVLLEGKVDKVEGKSLLSDAEIARLLTLTNYTLPTATANTLGGVRVGAGLSITNGVLSTAGGAAAEAVEWSNILNKPAFKTVATTGSFNDLIDKPAIPVNSDFTLAALADTSVTLPSNNQLLKWNGSSWVNWTPNFLTSAPVASVAGMIGDVVLEIQDVVDLQTTLDSKETKATVALKVSGAISTAKSYTDTSIANVIGGAPEALDTLKELGDVLQANESAYDGLLQVVGGKADKNYVDTELEFKADIEYVDTALDNFLPNTYVPTWEEITGKPLEFAPRKYVATIGDGDSSTLRVTHGLNTEDFTYVIKEATTKQMIIADCKIIDANSVDFVFGAPPSSEKYKVVIIG